MTTAGSFSVSFTVGDDSAEAGPWQQQNFTIAHHHSRVVYFGAINRHYRTH